MNKRNVNLGLLITLLLAGIALDTMGKVQRADTNEPKSDPDVDPNHDPNPCDFDAEKADNDYEDFPVTYLADIFRTREDDRIDDIPDSTVVERACMRNDMDSFVKHYAEDFNKIERTIGAMYKALPADARASFLAGLADYCEMMKDMPQNIMLDAFKRRFEI
jgi:hypothetical protein